MIAHGMGLAQMLAATAGSAVVHGLWEHSAGRENPEARKRTVLFNTKRPPS
jgi:hypothetical protein